MSAVAKQPQKAAPSSTMSDQDINQNYQRLKNDMQAIAQKIGELESEHDEHSLVLQTLVETQQKDPQRKCFRLIGGTLVERTVKEVIPSLQTNNDGIQQVMHTLIAQYQGKEKELAAFCKEHNIQMTAGR